MDIFSDIMMLYYEMNNIYLELYKLELEGNKGSEFFLQLVGILKAKIKEEEKLLKLFYDSSQYDIVCEYASQEENPLFIRFLDRIKIYEAFNIDIDEEDLDEEAVEKEKLMKVSRMYSACNRNIFLIYLSFFQERIDSVDSIMREKLLSLKYYNSFTKIDMENSLIGCNFDVAMENYVDLYLMSDMIKLESNLCTEIILDCCLSTIMNMVIILLSISDDDRNDYDKRALSINCQSLFRACMVLLDDKEYRMVSNTIYEKVKELRNKENGVSVDIIDWLIGKRREDKTRVRKISFTSE